MLEPQFETARRHFDAKEYFEAHEVWEEMWNEAGGARHSFLQGLIQVAVALHHAGNGNFKGARKLFASALEYLDRGKVDSSPVDVDKLRELVLDFELAIQRKLTGESEALPFFPLPMR